MLKHRLTLLLSACFCVCVSSWAQESKILGMVSPKLRNFLMDHPVALKVLTNAYAETFTTTNRTVALYYFYSNDDSISGAGHFYPNTVGVARVIIDIRENQHPLDEFLGLLFEILNSRNSENVSVKLSGDVIDGTISRTEFAREVVKFEFEANKRVRDLLVSLKLGKKEKEESRCYGLYINVPNEFEAFLSYIKKVLRKRDPIKEYELQYDLLRQTP